MKKILLTLLISIASLSALPSGMEILKKLDDQQKLGVDVTARMVFIQVRPIQGTNKMEMMYYRRDKDDSFCILMLSPETDKGNGYLRSGDNMFMYRRNTRSFSHVGRDENIGGSDIKSGDLESRKMSDLYSADTNKDGKDRVEEAALGKEQVYKLWITAKADNVTYPKQTLYVRKSDYLILKIENKSGSGDLLLTQLFPNYKQIQGKWIAVLGYNIDEFEKGNWTMYQIAEMTMKPIADSVFTKAFLEEKSR